MNIINPGLCKKSVKKYSPGLLDKFIRHLDTNKIRRHRPLKNIKNYICYYGKADLVTLAKYDLLILEPSYYSKKYVEFLKKSSIAVAYCSIGEADEHELKNIVQKESLIYKKRPTGKIPAEMEPVKNEDWNSWYADPAKKGWIDYVIKKADTLIDDKGFDGIFLDTIDTVDLFPEKKQAMADLIQTLRKRYPNKIIIANRGLEIFELISHNIDAVMYECFTSKYDFEKKKCIIFNENDMKWIHSVYEKHLKSFIKAGKTVLALDYADGPDDKIIEIAYTRACDYGLVPLVSDVNLNKCRPYKGNNNKKYLKKYGQARFEKGDN